MDIQDNLQKLLKTTDYMFAATRAIDKQFGANFKESKNEGLAEYTENKLINIITQIRALPEDFVNFLTTTEGRRQLSNSLYEKEEWVA